MPRPLPYLLAGFLLLPVPLIGQGTVVTGTITDSATGAPIAGVQLAARSAEAAVHRTESDNRGQFRLTLPVGRYTLIVTAIGYRPQTLPDVGLTSGGPMRIDVKMVAVPMVMPAIEVVSRSREAIVDAPGAASVVDQKAIEERTALSPSDHLRDVPGVSLASKGLAAATFAARGPSAVNSASLLVLHDYRLASVPSLRLNVPYLIPITSEDIDRIEIARGPSSAIYGPDADRGVVNFITKSPFASRGTTASFTAGERGVFQGDFRHASQFGSRVAMKLSGEYFAGDDWPAVDPREVIARDPHIARASGEMRLDWRPSDNTTVIFSGGLAQAITAVDQTEIGSVQLHDWRYTFGQARLVRDRLMVNLFYNQNDAGKTVQLYTGAPVVDDSRVMSAQAQYGSALSDRVDLTYGVDLQRIIPRTGGTIHGRNEDHDNITQAGAYLSGTVALANQWSLVAATRADHHDRLNDFAVSPRIGLIFKPSEHQALRLTFNRATSTPVASDLFLDLLASDTPPYELRARGNLTGLTFRRDCDGGLCMRSPFVGNATQYLPLDGTLAWQGLVQVAHDSGVDLSAIPAPTRQDVGTVLARLNTETLGFDPVSAADVTDVLAGRRSYNSTVEAGYRGYLGDNFSVALDVYHSHLTNVGNPLTVQTPSAFLDGGMLAAYLSRFMPSADAQAITDLASVIPVGTVSPIEGDSTEILLFARQGAKANYWGADLALTAGLGRHFIVTGSYSWTEKDVVRSTGGFADIVFNAPKQSGSLGVTFREPRAGINAALRGRAVASFPVRSGMYGGEVKSYTVLDASLSYRLCRNPAVTIGLSATNMLDYRHQEFVGAPSIGRLVTARVRSEF